MKQLARSRMLVSCDPPILGTALYNILTVHLIERLILPIMLHDELHPCMAIVFLLPMYPFILLMYLGVLDLLHSYFVHNNNIVLLVNFHAGWRTPRDKAIHNNIIIMYDNFFQDNIENVVIELECIWRNGRYCFDVDREMILLKFDVTQDLVGRSLQTSSDATTVEWKEEQVKDFIHKLGFLEPEKEQKKIQDTFMAVTDVSTKQESIL